jgi:hypothetical protein
LWALPLLLLLSMSMFIASSTSLPVINQSVCQPSFTPAQPKTASHKFITAG